MERRTTSIKIDPDLWKKVRKYCIDKEMDVSDYIEGLIKVDMERKNKGVKTSTSEI
jgi:macrodomain Ter protein organizer (MatP/YcbG family)